MTGAFASRFSDGFLTAIMFMLLAGCCAGGGFKGCNGDCNSKPRPENPDIDYIHIGDPEEAHDLVWHPEKAREKSRARAKAKAEADAVAKKEKAK